MSFNIADVFELAVDHYAEREYVVCDPRRIPPQLLARSTPPRARVREKNAV